MHKVCLLELWRIFATARTTSFFFSYMISHSFRYLLSVSRSEFTLIKISTSSSHFWVELYQGLLLPNFVISAVSSIGKWLSGNISIVCFYRKYYRKIDRWHNSRTRPTLWTVGDNNERHRRWYDDCRCCDVSKRYVYGWVCDYWGLHRCCIKSVKTVQI